MTQHVARIVLFEPEVAVYGLITAHLSLLGFSVVPARDDIDLLVQLQNITMNVGKAVAIIEHTPELRITLSPVALQQLTSYAIPFVVTTATAETLWPNDPVFLASQGNYRRPFGHDGLARLADKIGELLK